MNTESSTYLKIVKIVEDAGEAPVEYIALKANLTASQATEAIEKLKKLNLIEDASDNKVRLSSKKEVEIPSMEQYYSLND